MTLHDFMDADNARYQISGSVSMGSVGSWEPISFWVVGSGTHQFWNKKIEFTHFLSGKEQKHSVFLDFGARVEFGNPWIENSNGATGVGYSASSGKSCMILPKFAPKFMLYLMFCRHFRKKVATTEGHKRLKYQFWSLKNDIGQVIKITFYQSLLCRLNLVLC